MPPKLCCCQCLIFADNFDRADNASLGTSWTEYPSSAFEINTNRVRSVDGGIAICNVIHPTPSGSMVVSIETVDEHSGDVYDLLLNVKDNLNYHRARFTINSSTTSTIELSIVVGGAVSVLKTETVLSLTGTSRVFTAMIADHEFCATVQFGLVSLTWANTTLITGGYYSGIGTPNTGLLMDAFTFGHHLQTKAQCPSCVCQCLERYIALRLNVHMEGSGRMSPLNCDFVIEWDRINQYWKGSATCCTVFWDLILNCGAVHGDWDTKGLFNSSLQCFGPGPSSYAPTNGSCDPFFLEFGPFLISATGDLACNCDGHTFPEAGSYTITITEIP